MKISEMLIVKSTPVEGVVTDSQKRFIEASELYLDEVNVYLADFYHYVDNFSDSDDGLRFKEFYKEEIVNLIELIKLININMEVAEDHIPSNDYLKKCGQNRCVVIQYLASLNSIAQKEISGLS